MTPHPRELQIEAVESRAARDRETLAGSADRSDPAGRQPSFWRRHKAAVSGVIAAVVAAGFVYYVVPRLVGLGPTLRLLRRGDVWWLALGVVLEALSYAGSIVLFHGVFGARDNGIGWSGSSQITLAGAAATKVAAAAGAGGIALTAWALHAYGLSGAQVADGMVCFEILTYGVYMAAIAIAGFGLYLGLFSGSAPVGMTLIPAVFATAVIVIVLSMLFVDEPVERFLRRRAERSSGHAAGRWRRIATVPRSIHAGLLAAIDLVKRRDRSIVGALAGWGFDIGVLWAAFHAFGHSPPGAVLVMSYYVGSLAERAASSRGNRRSGGRDDRRFPRLRSGESAGAAGCARLPDDLLLASDGPRRHRVLAPAPAICRVARTGQRRPKGVLRTMGSGPTSTSGPGLRR